MPMDSSDHSYNLICPGVNLSGLSFTQSQSGPVRYVAPQSSQAFGQNPFQWKDTQTNNRQTS